MLSHASRFSLSISIASSSAANKLRIRSHVCNCARARARARDQAEGNSIASWDPERARAYASINRVASAPAESLCIRIDVVTNMRMRLKAT